MFGSIGLQEILLILGIALLLFGARRLPEIGRGLGKGISEFKRASREIGRQVTDGEEDKNGAPRDAG